MHPIDAIANAATMANFIVSMQRFSLLHRSLSSDDRLARGENYKVYADAPDFFLDAPDRALWGELPANNRRL